MVGGIQQRVPQALLGTFLAALICAPAVAQPALPFGITSDEFFGFVLRNSKWPKNEISVCWENPSAEDEKWRKLVAVAVEESWQKHSALTFTGWGKCEANSLGVRIRIADTPLGAHTKALGKYLDGQPDGLVLDFKFENWSDGCQEIKEFCVRALAVHEFGHVIGLSHEQNRDDAPKQCRKEQIGQFGDYKVTKYDPLSVMNYCEPWWQGDGKLSALDIVTVQKFYGARQ